MPSTPDNRELSLLFYIPSKKHNKEKKTVEILGVTNRCYNLSPQRKTYHIPQLLAECQAPNSGGP